MISLTSSNQLDVDCWCWQRRFFKVEASRFYSDLFFFFSWLNSILGVFPFFRRSFSHLLKLTRTERWFHSPQQIWGFCPLLLHVTSGTQASCDCAAALLSIGLLFWLWYHMLNICLTHWATVLWWRKCLSHMFISKPRVKRVPQASPASPSSP